MEGLTGLAEFLVEAKRSSYASGSSGKREKDHSITFVFEQGDWRYEDRHFGSDHFIGHETVWKKNKPIWGMNYRGVRIDTLFEEKSLFAFLREALKRVEISRPYRGPDNFSSHGLTYSNFSTGGLADFRGIEFVYQTGRAVYQLDYHGGTVSTEDQ